MFGSTLGEVQQVIPRCYSSLSPAFERKSALNSPNCRVWAMWSFRTISRGLLSNSLLEHTSFMSNAKVYPDSNLTLGSPRALKWGRRTCSAQGEVCAGKAATHAVKLLGVSISLDKCTRRNSTQTIFLVILYLFMMCSRESVFHHAYVSGLHYLYFG